MDLNPDIDGDHDGFLDFDSDIHFFHNLDCESVTLTNFDPDLDVDIYPDLHRNMDSVIYLSMNHDLDLDLHPNCWSSNSVTSSFTYF